MSALLRHSIECPGLGMPYLVHNCEACRAELQQALDRINEAMERASHGFAAMLPAAKTLADSMSNLSRTTRYTMAQGKRRGFRRKHYYDPGANPNTPNLHKLGAGHNEEARVAVETRQQRRAREREAAKAKRYER